MHYVLEGGSLLQRLPWKKEATFKDICQAYIDYLRRTYGTPIIVFDGYDTFLDKNSCWDKNSRMFNAKLFRHVNRPIL